MTTSVYKKFKLNHFIQSGDIELERGAVISGTDMNNTPGDYPVYSSSVENKGLFGQYGRFMFDEELITWSVDGGGNFFYRPKHKFSITNVSGILRIKSKRFIYKYLFYLLDWEHKRKTFNYVEKAHPSVIKELYEIYDINVSEQNKIAEVLSTIDGAIERTDALIEKYKRMKTGMMQDLFRYGIDDKGNIRSEKTHKFKNSPLGKIPAEWNVAELGKIADVQRGKFQHRPRNDPRFYGGSIPFVQTGDIANANRDLKSFSQTLNEKGLRLSRLFPKGTIIITIAANVGDVAIASFDVAFPDSLVGIRVSNLINRDFLYYYLCTRKPDLNSMATESAQKNINLGVLNPYPVIYPLKDEQEKLAKILTRIDENINNEEINRGKLTSVKAGLMEDLLTGIVRVNHLAK